jgi:hypothetical protein
MEILSLVLPEAASPPHLRMSALPPKADIACDPGKSAKCQKRTCEGAALRVPLEPE